MMVSLMATFDRIEKSIRTIAIIAGGVSATTLFLMMSLTFCDVIGRYLLNKPIEGASDITELMMVLIVFLAMAYTQICKGHVQVDLLFVRMPKRIQAILETVYSIFSAGILILISWRLAIRSWNAILNPAQEESDTIGIPYSPFLIMAAFGCFVFFCVVCADIYRSFSRSLHE